MNTQERYSLGMEAGGAGRVTGPGYREAHPRTAQAVCPGGESGRLRERSFQRLGSNFRSGSFWAVRAIIDRTLPQRCPESPHMRSLVNAQPAL
jgi:hypothetical protein